MSNTNTKLKQILRKCELATNESFTEGYRRDFLELIEVNVDAAADLFLQFLEFKEKNSYHGS